MHAQTQLLRTIAIGASLSLAATQASAQTLGCSLNGGSAVIPAVGTGGGGVYPGTLPPSPAIATLNVASVPGGAAFVTEVTIRNLTHSYISDLQFVLTSPSGAQHNLFVRSPAGGALPCNLSGDYSIVSAGGGCSLTTPTVCGTADILPPGPYEQLFGTWPSGTSGIDNTPLNTIPAAAGTWTLTVYDWAGADVGGFSSFEVCFGGANPVVPAPAATAPAPNATVSAPVTLDWEPLSCALSYDVELDGVVTTSIPTDFLSVSPSPGPHNWRVRLVATGGPGPWSALRTFTVLPPPPPTTCVSGSGGGLIPLTGTGGGGVWPTAFPPNELALTANIVPPSPTAQLIKVQLQGLSHTWVGDLQFVLTDPTGGRHNLICRPNFPAAAFGLDCDLDGTDYEIFAAGQNGIPTACPGTSFPGGNYNQHFGSWNSGDLGVFNTPLSAIPVSAGNWTLSVYDWANGDGGALTNWSLCFSGPVAPPTFCTPPGTTTSGCSPTISATGNPNVAQNNNCVITVANVEGQKQGLLFYGVSGQVNFPWCPSNSPSLLCVKAPTQRIFPQGTGGTAGQCNGQLQNDWNLFQNTFVGAVGAPFSAGTVVTMQGWFRDPPACKTTFLSQGITLTYQP
jgi:subtilisin-like proprotein convertase family protein